MQSTNYKWIISPQIKYSHSFNPKLKIGILASGKGSNFEAIIKAISQGELDAQIECIVVNKESCGALDKAKHYCIPYIIHKHEDFSSREEMDAEIIRTFNNYDIEGIIMVGWMRIVSKVLLKKFKGRIINLHPSLLPSFKGSQAIEKTLSSSVHIAGCSVHFVEEMVDSGEILVQAALTIDDGNKTKDKLQKCIQELEHKIIIMGIIIAGKRWRLDD